jgi:hypothetical protein
MIRLNNCWPEVAISYKNKSKWSKTKQPEPKLFELYPDIKRAYDLAQDLRNIFEKQQIKLLDYQD